MDVNDRDADLLAEYTDAFQVLDDLESVSPVASELQVGMNAYGWPIWKPRRIETPRSALEALYRALGLPGRNSTRFPPLYETLVLSYRWMEVDLDNYLLLANEPKEDLSPLLSALRKDMGLYETLVPNGFFQFGHGAGGDYDPVCFDFRQRQRNGDCRIVKLDHEEILINFRIRETAELAPNFRSLVLNTIRTAAVRQTGKSDNPPFAV